MAKYFEERFQWRLTKEKDKRGVATQFIRESGTTGAMNGVLGFSGAPKRNVRWAPRGHGHTPYPASARPTERRWVFHFVETEDPSEEGEVKGSHTNEGGSLAEQGKE